MQQRIHVLALLGILLAAAAPPSVASEIGHFAPGVMRPRDVIQPPPGSYFAQYNAYYTTDTYKDRHGNKVNSVNVRGRTVSIDVDVDSYNFIPAFLHVTETKILGANYGFFIMQPFGNMSVGAALSTTAGRGLATDDSTFALGDTYVQPVWLGWDVGESNQLVLGYGFYAPTGKYDGDDTSNVGLGFWSNQFEGVATHYFDQRKATALTSTVTYEIHGNKEDTDIEPGDDIAFSIGIDQMLPVSKDWIGNIGLETYGQWQVTDDKGNDASRTDVHDRVYGVGLNAGLTYVPWLGQIDMHWTHEFKAIDRFEGDYYILTLGIPL